MSPSVLSFLLLMFTAPVFLTAADAAAPAATPAVQGSKAGGVDAVVADPKAYAGPVTITGVVSRVFPKTGSFVLIDSQEYAACGDLNCAAVTLPVQTPNGEFTGELPQLADTVVITGEVVPLDKGLKLTVTEVKKGETVIRQRK